VVLLRQVQAGPVKYSDSGWSQRQARACQDRPTQAAFRQAQGSPEPNWCQTRAGDFLSTRQRRALTMEPAPNLG